MNIDLTGENIKLNNVYTLWSHDVLNKNWTLSSYKKICVIDNVSAYWRYMNNFCRIGYRHQNYYFMKDGILPLWEHEENKHGGEGSFKIETDNFLEVYEEIMSYMVGGELSSDMDDINGIAFTPRNNWILIKIWNKDKNKNMINSLNKKILNKYGLPQYTPNVMKYNFKN